MRLFSSFPFFFSFLAHPLYRAVNLLRIGRRPTAIRCVCKKAASRNFSIDLAVRGHRATGSSLLRYLPPLAVLLADNGPPTHNPGRPPDFDVRFYLLVLGQILATRAFHLRLLSPRRCRHRRRRRDALRLNIGGDSDGSGRSRNSEWKVLTESGAGRSSSKIYDDFRGSNIAYSRGCVTVESQ